MARVPRAVPPRPSTTRREPTTAPVSRDGGGWFESSHDLLKGTEVIEDPAALDDELIDALFPPPKAPTRQPR